MSTTYDRRRMKNEISLLSIHIVCVCGSTMEINENSFFSLLSDL